jgi:adenine-specific DNA-methyltransferase
MRNRKAQSRAIELRKSMTDAERRLWQALRLRQMAGYKFHRQCPLGPFIADFACIEAKLVVEVDGGQHAEHVVNDQARSAWLETNGFVVLRFWNDDVLLRMDDVLESIFSTLRQCTHPNPPPQAGEGVTT